MSDTKVRILPVLAIALALVLFAVGVVGVNVTGMTFGWKVYIVGCLAYGLYAAIYDATEALYVRKDGLR